jgi:sortase A
MRRAQRADNLSVGELEALLFEKRRRVSEERARRFAEAERKLVASLSAATDKAENATTLSRPPDSWRGARGQERYFHSTKLLPLGVEMVRQSVGAQASAPAASVRPRRRWRDVALLGFEIVALVVFVGILVTLYGRMQTLNREARAVQRSVPTTSAVETPTSLPTATPVMLLPGGERSTTAGPNTSAANVVPKLAIPLAKPPTPGPQTARRLVIAKLGVDAPVVEGDSDEDLKKGIGHHVGSVNPGEKGNMVVSAHNDVYGEIFRDLNKLEPGAEVLVYTDAGAFRYVVNRVEIVLPTQVEVMNPTDYPALTMITCYPYLLDTHRVIVVADLAK